MPFFLLLLSYFLFYSGFQWLLPGMHLIRLLAIVMVVLWLFSGKKLIRNRLLYTLLLFIPIMMLSVPGSYLKSLSLELSFDFLKFVVIAFLAAHFIETPRQLAVFLSLLLIVHLFLAKGAIGQHEVIEADMARIGAQGFASGGFLGDANDFALGLNVISPFALFLFLYARSKLVKLTLLGSLLVYLGAIIMTFSRGGFLTLLATAVAACWRTKRLYFGLLLAAALGLSLVLFAPASYFARMETTTDVQVGDTSYGRLQLWTAGLYMLLEHPLTGVGLGAFSSAYGRTYAGYVHHYKAKWHVAHSGYVTMAAELGLGGIALYLYVFYLIFKQNADVRRRLAEAGLEGSFLFAVSSAVTVSLIAYAVGSTFLTACYYPHLYLLLALTVAVGEMASRQIALPAEARLP